VTQEFIDTEEEAAMWRPAPWKVQFSTTVSEIFPALVEAQKEMGSAHKGSRNPFFQSTYADLSEVIEVCKDAMNKNGLAILQPIATGEKGVVVTTLLTHTSGEWLSSSVDFPVGKLDSQEYGKAISYGRRYSLLSFLSIPTEAETMKDDDGETARKQAPVQSKPIPPVAASQATAPVEAPRTQTMVLEPSPVQEVSLTEEGDVDFMAFAVNEDRIAQVLTVEEKTSRDGTKTWWVLSFASKDKDFTAKMWDPPSMYQMIDYEGLIGQSVWYRVSEKEYRGAMQYTLHFLGLVDPE
jgi:hypothetical protein